MARKSIAQKQAEYCEAFRASVRVLKKLGAWRDWYALFPLDRLQAVCSAAQEAADAAHKA